jgi:hypothetical protein
MQKLQIISKTLGGAVQIAVLMAGLLFSCTPFTNNDYGTLVIALPGGGGPARAAGDPVSSGFTAALKYRIECTGAGNKVTREVSSGASVAIPLDVGDWSVTLSVFNAAGQTIGSGTAQAKISGGNTTTVQIPVAIDTSGNDIASFSITSPVSAEGVITQNDKAVTVHVPAGTARNAMQYFLVHTGASVTPAASGTLDFSSPKTFTVTAENGTTVEWSVEVIVDSGTPSGSNNITSFSITSPVSAAGEINQSDKTVTVHVPTGTARNAMQYFLVHTGASVEPAASGTLDFSSPKTFTVTAENGTTVEWSVEVIVDSGTPSGSNNITSFSITSPVSAAGVINQSDKTVTVHVPAGTARNAMQYFLVHTGASVEPAASGTLDFSSPKTFTVTAENGTPKIWSVEVLADSTYGGTETWPSVSRLTPWGLADLTQPPGSELSITAGTTISDSSERTLYIICTGASMADYEHLVSRLTTICGGPGTNGSTPPYYEQDFSYTYSSASYTASVMYMTVSGEEMLALDITDTSFSGPVTWPSATKWEEFGLPGGLTEPVSYTLEEINELWSLSAPSDDGIMEGMTVTMGNIVDDDYDNFVSEINGMTGAVHTESEGVSGDSYREDTFLFSGSIPVYLMKDYSEAVITVGAVRMLE